jgi:hypothetical protein
MGIDRKVTVPADTVPTWPRLTEFCAARHYPLKLLMIDGELCFPDEQPSDAWSELRVGTLQGMVTLRREQDGIRLVTWGNAEGPLLLAWNGLTWALAETFGGMIHDAERTMSASEFARKAEMPAEMKRVL